MRKFKNIIVCFYILLACLTSSLLNVELGSKATSLPENTIITGFFGLTNTSESAKLFQKWIYTSAIGVTWNLTITLAGSSSSAVRFNLTISGSIPQHYIAFEGIETFTILPGKTHRGQFIAHIVSDEAPGFDFQYSLVEVNGSANGEYCIEQTFPGYPVNIGIGELYVSNITAWLLTYPFTTAGSAPSFPFYFGATVILLLLIQRRKMRKR
ncbi:hypothetical protein CEE45_08595 [Candidatus Heimdallarchaeota archaeon B3_Heim]|nr:MAG: hypothetical protein CEE45_08595 [Candidatus Heimdallarchaeota archaeon B3_Heim]